MRSFAFVTALLAGYAAAQAAPAPAPGATVHTVIVGGVTPPADASSSPTPQFYFQPESVIAAVGDTVHFIFLQANHTVTQSTFDQPCKALPNGIDSGFLSNPTGADGITFSMIVPTADPLWFYCKQRTGSHCGKGMVFSVNPKPGVEKGSHTLFKQQAIQQNGTNNAAGIQAAAPPAAPSTVTVVAQPGAATGGAGGGAELAPSGANPPGAVATVAPGVGTGAGGQCSCQCLCGVGAFPSNVGQGAFGGFQGIMRS